jgi:putative endonuclease
MSAAQARGTLAWHAGLAAEDSVARHYVSRGMVLAARRWRGRSGEIDLILREGARVVFVEVKQSATHDQAANHITPRQIGRIVSAAEEFLAREPAGLATDMRLDVALVDGAGRLQIVENALMA